MGDRWNPSPRTPTRRSRRWSRPGFSPKFLFFLERGELRPPSSRTRLGQRTPRASSAAGDWFPTSQVQRQHAVRQRLHPAVRRHGVSASTRPSAEAYAVGQLIEAVAKKDRQGGQQDDHHVTALGATWPSVEGNISWDANGAPQGSDMLLEWLSGKLVPVYPPSAALANPVFAEGRLGAGDRRPREPARRCISSSRRASSGC